MPGDTTHTPPASVEASPLPGARAGHCRVGPHRIAYLAHNEHLLPLVDEDPDLLPLVFVQGLSMSVRFWEVAMLEPIRRRLPWYSVSLPLHFPCTYDGDPGRAELSTETFGRLLGETIRHLVGERRVRVVGHSVGAFAALAYAADYSHRCDAVMSIGGFTSGRAQGLEGKLQLLTLLGAPGRAAFLEVWRAKQRSRRFTEWVVEHYAHDVAALRAYTPFDPTLDLVHADMQHYELAGIYAMVRWLAEVDVASRADEVLCPVWAVAGTHDPVVAFAHQAEYARSLPRGELYAFEGAGHLLFAERERRFSELLLAYARLGQTT